MRRSRFVLVVLTTLAVAVAGSCGTDRPDRTAFIDHMTSLSTSGFASSPQWRQIWGCTYDRISDDDALSRLMDLEEGERPASELSAQVSNAIAKCAGTGSTSTSAPGTSTGATTGTSSPR